MSNRTNDAISIQLEYSEGNLRCQARPQSEEPSQFAWYLFHGDDRVATQWYSTDRQVSFKISQSGVYHVACFMKAQGSLVIQKSEPLQVLLPAEKKAPVHLSLSHRAPISIFGSCVSRDIFNYDTAKFFDLKSYIARQSIVSALAQPIPCSLEQIGLESSFQRRMVYHDLVKDCFDLLAHDGSQFLIVDLIDERFSLAQVSDSLITWSNEMAASGFLKEPPALIAKEKQMAYVDSTGTEHKIDLLGCVDLFCDRILSLYPQEHVIIHKAMMMNYYITSSGKCRSFPLNYLMHSRKINSVLSAMYQRMSERMPKAAVIDLCGGGQLTKNIVGAWLPCIIRRNIMATLLKFFSGSAPNPLPRGKGQNLSGTAAAIFYADEKHRWGLAPMHYQSSYYVETVEKLYGYVMTS